MVDPEHWIADKNIARFEEQLAKEIDSNKKRVLEELLAEEHVRLQSRRSAPRK